MKTKDTDALARLLDGASANGEAPAQARALAALASAIESRATTTPTPAFREDLRARLLAEAVAPPAPSWAVRLRTSWDNALARFRYSMRVATASGIAAMTLSTGGVAAATTMSVPGDLFYGLKIAVEDARLVRAGDELSRGWMLLGFAEERVDEAQRAAASERMDAAVTSLTAADEAAREGAGAVIETFLHDGDETALTELTAWTAELRPRLDALRPALAGGALSALDDLGVALDRIDARVEALTVGCCPDAQDGPRPGVPAPGVGFDFTRIPPADEPFNACPCPPSFRPQPPVPVVDPTPDGSVEPQPGATPIDQPTPQPQPQPSPTPPPGDEPDDEPGALPDPVQEPVDGLQDTLDDILDDVLGPPVSATESPLRGTLQDTVDRLLP